MRKRRPSGGVLYPGASFEAPLRGAPQDETTDASFPYGEVCAKGEPNCALHLFSCQGFQALTVSAAPHLPAGIFSPQAGRRTPSSAAFANRQRRRISPSLRPSVFSPFTGRSARQGDEGRRRTVNHISVCITRRWSPAGGNCRAFYGCGTACPPPASP